MLAIVISSVFVLVILVATTLYCCLRTPKETASKNTFTSRQSKEKSVLWQSGGINNSHFPNLKQVREHGQKYDNPKTDWTMRPGLRASAMAWTSLKFVGV
ncbi:hypothetical protein DPMN_095147 [Dreissena polymorpha]|uniref:Uncharacterized protein n=1 Tax=Dreissena polymorpha TaxID=45954 RepID=A0A9D4L7D1_DREPO|nr:hypothetical protein DPMN_095147 [Dreissena polymorpha]